MEYLSQYNVGSNAISTLTPICLSRHKSVTLIRAASNFQNDKPILYYCADCDKFILDTAIGLDGTITQDIFHFYTATKREVALSIILKDAASLEQQLKFSRE